MTLLLAEIIYRPMVGWLMTNKLERTVYVRSRGLIWGTIPRCASWDWGRLWTTFKDGQDPSGDFNHARLQCEGGILTTHPERLAKFHQNLLNSIYVKWVMNWHGDMWLLVMRTFYAPVAKNVLRCEIFTVWPNTVAVQLGRVDGEEVMFCHCFARSQGAVCVYVYLDVKHTKQHRCRLTIDTSYPYHLLTTSFIHPMMAVSSVTQRLQATSHAAHRMKLKYSTLFTISLQCM
jgi:hypothetical protein